LRSIAIVVVLAVSTALALWAATPAEQTQAAGTKTKAKTATTAKKSTSAKRKSAKTTSAKTTSAKAKSAKQAAAGYRRSTQKEPDPERYKEIQQSLADKGYFAGPVTGTWGPGSVEALKRFQRDQNIGDDGKLGSLSLIALGLGPKRGTSGATGAEKPENPAAGPPPP
jgi:peptidoglycan hydrolase-like protein with peptidoglycan-binding domain